MTDTIFRLELREPIKNIAGEEVAVLELRKPRGGDILRCGNPVRYVPGDDQNEITFDEAKLGKMLSALSAIPLPMIERMDPNDMMDCAWAIAPFFLPGFRRKPPAQPAQAA